ncbi:hypothetical protein BCR44DRAFT_1438681 [Catenaria anguillulae PL171]|uniref:Uncharacterized protein n=1 Tax=Catenaria anguillulae PL171 TaxID=765915 RepID=A0A1Y2HFC9_9FUNG|nr:hypothetical protein BCR44DRAFT_1438681 [Catenaria anguillulae PL171]
MKAEACDRPSMQDLAAGGVAASGVGQTTLTAAFPALLQHSASCSLPARAITNQFTPAAARTGRPWNPSDHPSLDAVVPSSRPRLLPRRSRQRANTEFHKTSVSPNAETDSADGPSLTKRRNASRAHQAPKSTKKKRKGNGKKDWAIARPRINGRYVSYEEYAEHHGLDINSTIEAFRPAKAMKCDPAASGQNDASGDDPGAPIPSSNADPGSSDNQENTPFPCDERRRNDSLPAFEEVVHSDPAPSGSPSLAHSLSGTFCSPDVADMNMASSEAAGQGSNNAFLLGSSALLSN